MDAVMIRYAARISGIGGLAVNSLDVLSGLPTVKIAVAYRYRGEILQEFPASLKVLAECEPVYEEFGDLGDVSGKKSLAELPSGARRYLDRLQELAEAPLSLVSLGRERQETLVVGPLF